MELTVDRLIAIRDTMEENRQGWFCHGCGMEWWVFEKFGTGCYFECDCGTKVTYGTKKI